MADSVAKEYPMSKKTRIPQVSDEQVARAFSGVSDGNVDQTVAERSGSDDKVQAVKAENAPAKVKTFTPEAVAWLESDPYGLKTEGLYGQRGRFAIRPRGDGNPGDFGRRAQFLGRPLNVADLEEVHSLDPSAPVVATNCTVCNKAIASFVRTAMINKEGDLVRDKDENIVYRGQFVVTGKPLDVYPAHTGNCLYALRNARNKKKKLENGRQVADLLPSQAFDQANARLAGIQGSYVAKAAEKTAFQERLGFKVGDAVRKNRSDDGIDRGSGSFVPRTPRGQRRNEPRSWK